LQRQALLTAEILTVVASPVHWLQLRGREVGVQSAVLSESRQSLTRESDTTRRCWYERWLNVLGVQPRSFLLKSLHLAVPLLALLCGGLALMGCGGSARHGANVAQPGNLDRATSASVLAGPNGRQRSPRLFSSTSVWNQPLPPDAPLDPHSAQTVAALDGELAREEAAGTGPWINTISDGVPILTVSADQATVRVQLDHAPDSALSSAWSAVPLPAAAQPSRGGEGYLVVWQPSTDRMWEFWRLNRQGDDWHASWGGAIRHVSTSPGVYGPGAWPGAKPWWGATASSLALAGGAMTIEELRRGQIEHALAIAVPDVRAGVFASPAQRTDGRSLDPLALPEGAHLRLDPRLNLSSLKMSPLTREMALAAQRYGIIVRDFASNIAFFGQDPTPTGSDPYLGPSGLFEGEYPTQLLASFPWSHLQLLKMELHANP
jgi:hypothetical protein